MEVRNIFKCLMAVSFAAFGIALPGTAWADTYQALDLNCAPSATQSTTEIMTIERPVILQKTEKTFEKQVIVQRSRVRASMPARRRVLAVRPRLVTHRTGTLLASSNRSKFIEKTVERTTEKPIMVERPVVIEKTVEKPVYIDRVIEKPVTVEVEKPVVIEKQVQLEQAPTVVQPTVIEQKEGHHLFNLKLF